MALEGDVPNATDRGNTIQPFTSGGPDAVRLEVRRAVTAEILTPKATSSDNGGSTWRLKKESAFLSRAAVFPCPSRQGLLSRKQMSEVRRDLLSKGNVVAALWQSRIGRCAIEHGRHFNTFTVIRQQPPIYKGPAPTRLVSMESPEESDDVSPDPVRVEQFENRHEDGASGRMS